MKFTVSDTDRGTLRIDWDMGADTDALLREYAELRGVTFDDLMDYLNQELRRRILAVRAAKLRRN